MKKKLIILVEILLLIVFLRSDFAGYFLEDIKQAVANTMDTFTQMPETRELQKFRDSIEPRVANMSESQQSYMSDVTESKDTINRFYYLYCVNKDINPHIYGANLVYFCGEINRSGLTNI